MERNPDKLSKFDLQARIDHLERELATNPIDGELLRFLLAQTRDVMNELYDKPLSVVEEEYRVLMQEESEGKALSGEAVLLELRALMGVR